MAFLSGLITVLGAIIGLIAGVGLLRLKTPYARFHAGGKASPVAFLVTALGAGLALGVASAAYLAIAAAAMVVTLPVGVHLLFRSVHRTTESEHLLHDDLRTAMRERMAKGE